MDFTEFSRAATVVRDEVCRQVWDEHRRSIRVKKEATLVRNLTSIFDAVLGISYEKGFQAMTMRDLSRRTGLSMGGLYAYFSGKDELLEMLQKTGRRVSLRVLAESQTGLDDPADKLRAAVETHLYLSEVMQPWFYFTYMEARHLSAGEKERAVAGELATEDILAGIIEEGRQEGRFETSDVRMTAAVLKAMLQDWYVKRAKYARRGVSVDRYAGFVIEFVTAGLTPAGRDQT